MAMTKFVVAECKVRDRGDQFEGNMNPNIVQ